VQLAAVDVCQLISLTASHFLNPMIEANVTRDTKEIGVHVLSIARLAE